MNQQLTTLRAQGQSALWDLEAVLKALPTAIALLADSQPGYPSGGEGGSSPGSHSDRTGNLACSPPDFARRDHDDLVRLMRRIRDDAKDAAMICARWKPPSAQWRDDLATEAGAAYVDTWCKSHLRVKSMEPRRSEGGNLCRWCQDVARDIGAGMPPEWLVDKRSRGVRITSADLDRARSEAKASRKKRRR